MNNIIDKLKEKRELYKELETEMSSPDLLSNREQYKAKAKEYSDLKELVNMYEEYLVLEEEKNSLENMIEEEAAESEYATLARKELDEVVEELEKKRNSLEEMFLEEESEDLKKNVIMEIRAGTGGTEASLFAADLYKMYSKYAIIRNWKTSLISLSESEMGGIKEIIFTVEGASVYKWLRFEMGTHRVQRVPETEASGRIHTSAATVVVLPEADDVDVEIKAQDLRIDTFRASGAGGQHVNTTDSAIRMTHLPSGIVVSCQDERSQHKNKVKAMRVLKARVLEKTQADRRKDVSEQRKKQVGSGDRSEKIRTYNFPENRVTDHRIGLTVHNLANILEGEMIEIVDGLIEADKKLRLESA